MKFYLVTVTYKSKGTDSIDGTEDSRYIVKASCMTGALEVSRIFYDNSNVEGFSCYLLDSFFDTDTQQWMSV